MTADPVDPADIIAAALSRLRGRRQHPHDHGPHEHGPHGMRPRGRRSPWGADGGLRHGAPALIRMVEALSAASEPLSVSGLAEAIGVDQPRASRLVQQGVDRGWVRREADPDDARRTRIALTSEGVRLFRGVRGERREALGRALAAFTDEESAELARLLTKLADNWNV
ncbi:DNA-binding MarR family transcriptional regulator [Microbacterium sp. W4I4]|uniref:MarR family winged helix-turn-helix transcriptional regulator n=1 Tax=Microbacterium sp. W4I4 TaxID=3042295 RepID=UPI00277D42F8|nr:MarR family transcriptional regulator [Microbacterium sp. W4I4]MDQ0614825.1 DNA-binding MarR family transcriptional regulator [Microbacterium sp. W4I4]